MIFSQTLTCEGASDVHKFRRECLWQPILLAGLNADPGRS